MFKESNMLMALNLDQDDVSENVVHGMDHSKHVVQWYLPQNMWKFTFLTGFISPQNKVGNENMLEICRDHQKYPRKHPHDWPSKSPIKHALSNHVHWKIPCKSPHFFRISMTINDELAILVGSCSFCSAEDSFPPCFLQLAMVKKNMPINMKLQLTSSRVNSSYGEEVVSSGCGPMWWECDVIIDDCRDIHIYHACNIVSSM